MRHPKTHLPRTQGFTLVELLVILAIIGLIVGLLVPSLVRARAAARDIGCANNIRQTALAMINYATCFDGAFPPTESSFGASHWATVDIIAKFIGGRPKFAGSQSLVAAALVCPADAPPVNRSYSINLWASTNRSVPLRTPPLLGTFFRLGVPRDSSKLILVTEGWSYLGNPSGYESDVFVGGRGYKPGEKFVGLAIGGVTLGRWSLVETELDYSRHRQRGISAAKGSAVGRIHIGYVDGHVALKSDRDLGDRGTSTSTFDSLWSPLDYQLQ